MSLFWEPLSSKVAVSLMLAMLGGSETRSREVVEDESRVCERLIAHIGTPAVQRRDSARPDDDPGFQAVCVRVAMEAKRQGVAVAVAVAVAYRESGMRWSPQASAKFLGPMQVGRKWCKAPEAGCVPDGVGHLKRWREKSRDWKEAIWSYTGGKTRGLSRKQRARKRKHTAKVMALIDVLEGRGGK